MFDSLISSALSYLTSSAKSAQDAQKLLNQYNNPQTTNNSQGTTYGTQS